MNKVIVMALTGITSTMLAHLGDTPEKEQAHFFYPPSRTRDTKNFSEMEFHHKDWVVIVRFVNNHAIYECWLKPKFEIMNGAAKEIGSEIEVDHKTGKGEIDDLVKAYNFVYDGGSERYLNWHNGNYWMEATITRPATAPGKLVSSVTIGDFRYLLPEKMRREQTKSTFN